MSDTEFKAWPKISRQHPFMGTITEKMDGTNACIIIEGEKVVGVQSRKRLITPKDDNYGFAAWVEYHTDDLSQLGEGYHYGEWAGLGIQKNPHCLPEKEFFLFNTMKWCPENTSLPDCCSVVPVLYEGLLSGGIIESTLEKLKGNAEGDERPEGIIVYYWAFRRYTKHTIKSPNGKWCKE